MELWETAHGRRISGPLQRVSRARHRRRTSPERRMPSMCAASVASGSVPESPRYPTLWRWLSPTTSTVLTLPVSVSTWTLNFPAPKALECRLVRKPRLWRVKKIACRFAGAWDSALSLGTGKSVTREEKECCEKPGRKELSYLRVLPPATSLRQVWTFEVKVRPPSLESTRIVWPS